MEDLFYKYLALDTSCNKYAFENNWPYILQSTRNGLFYIEDNDSILFYTKRIKGDNTSPNVVVNFLGPNKKDLVVSFVKSQADKGISTIVKNIDISDLGWWISNGFKKTEQSWSKYSSCDDNSFPQYNVSNLTVVNCDFGKDIKQQIRKFNKNSKILTTTYDDSKDGEALHLLEEFAKYSENKGNDFASEIVGGHMFFFDTGIKRCIKLQHIENGELVGFSFLTPVDNIVFYNAVICKNRRNLMKYLVYQSMSFVTKHYPEINMFGMQGSENAGQDNLKRRLGPSVIINKTHIIYP